MRGAEKVVDGREERPRDVAQTIDEGWRHDLFGVGAHRDEVACGSSGGGTECSC
jgi:hypothetical protein